MPVIKELIASTGIILSTAMPGQDLKVLMIGNSFSICVGKNLPQIVNSIPGNSLTLASAYIGGCPLETHWKNIEAIEKNPDDPAGQAYQVNIWSSDPKQKMIERRGNVKELLTLEHWDVVTIQQASHCSPFYENYQPWADKLIAYIRAKAPQAKIVIQQTWAYRKDDARITELGTPSWGFDQAGMYERLTAAYRKLAETYSCPVIPVGLAVQLTRQNDSLKFKEATPAQKAALHWPDIPPQAGDPVGAYKWRKGADGELQIGADSIHLNERGEYLQACVWLAALYGIATEKIAYDSPTVGAEDCAFLRQMAQAAVDSFPQVSR